MLSVRDGGTADLGRLFERHHSKLYNHYVRVTGDRQLSEDPRTLEVLAEMVRGK